MNYLENFLINMSTTTIPVEEPKTSNESSIVDLTENLATQISTCTTSPHSIDLTEKKFVQITKRPLEVVGEEPPAKRFKIFIPPHKIFVPHQQKQYPTYRKKFDANKIFGPEDLLIGDNFSKPKASLSQRVNNVFPTVNSFSDTENNHSPRKYDLVTSHSFSDNNLQPSAEQPEASAQFNQFNIFYLQRVENVRQLKRATRHNNASQITTSTPRSNSEKPFQSVDVALGLLPNEPEVIKELKLNEVYTLEYFEDKFNVNKSSNKYLAFRLFYLQNKGIFMSAGIGQYKFVKMPNYYRL